jgi:hypothetical protein
MVPGKLMYTKAPHRPVPKLSAKKWPKKPWLKAQPIS